MTRRSAGLGAAGLILVAVFALAFVLAPRSCEGGLDLYFWSGVAALVVLLVLSFVVPLGRSLVGSFGWGLGLCLVGFGVWVGGLLVTNFQLLCRLF